MGFLKLKRGTTEKRLLYLPGEGELILDSSTNQLFVGDGITMGGVAAVPGNANVTVVSGYSNTDVANYLPTHAGNIGGNVANVSTILATTANISNLVVTGSTTLGNLGIGNITAITNIEGNKANSNASINHWNINFSNNANTGTNAAITVQTLRNSNNEVTSNILGINSNAVNLYTSLVAGNANVSVTPTNHVIRGNLLITTQGTGSGVVGAGLETDGNAEIGNFLTVGGSITSTGLNINSGVGGLGNLAVAHNSSLNLVRINKALTEASYNGNYYGRGNANLLAYGNHFFYDGNDLGNNFTMNFRFSTGNIAQVTNTFTEVTVAILQNATARKPNAATINGSSVTIRWKDNTEPNGNANKLDVFKFTIIADNSDPGKSQYGPYLLGEMTSYG